jgi:hypothetical protein
MAGNLMLPGENPGIALTVVSRQRGEDAMKAKP